MNWHDSGRFGTESLESAAKRYKTLGFSIIPLYGARNLQQPKLPAIKWAQFQRVSPSDQQIADWFAGQEGLGIGIVCGRISRLVVLDVDDAKVASEFRHLCPHLSNTFTVKSGTRDLPHFYFRLPDGLLIPTTAYPGADLRGEGSYVVAPPTQVGNMLWSVENDVPVRQLTDVDLQSLLLFLAGLKRKWSSSEKPRYINSELDVSEFRQSVTRDELVAFYHRYKCAGRNHALFRATLIARDNNVPQAVTALWLADVHAREVGDVDEGYQQRYQEGLRTISSGYSRSVRKIRMEKGLGLPNVVRECLLQRQMSAVARVLDALYMSNVSGGCEMTESQICRSVLQFKVGRRSVMCALKSRIDEDLIFSTIYSPHIPPQYANAASPTDNLINSCEMSRGANRVNNHQRGRPARLYRIPSPEDMARLFAVDAGGSDVLQTGELASGRAYRQGLHAHLIARRPGLYPRDWLSSRLGVTRWTTRRYERLLNIEVEPTFTVQALSWRLATALPTYRRDATYGVFIQSLEGNRYPALRGVALKLLKGGSMLVLKHQRVNRYSFENKDVGIPTPLSDTWDERSAKIDPVNSHRDRQVNSSPNGQRRQPSVGMPISLDGASTQPRIASAKTPTDHSTRDDGPPRAEQSAFGVGIPTPLTFWLCPECLDFHISAVQPERCLRCNALPIWEIVPSIIWHDSQALKAWWQTRQLAHSDNNRRNQSLVTPRNADIKVFASRLQAQVIGLSFTNARKLIQEFGVQMVENALEKLKKQRRVRSPAGFIISLLKSNNKLYKYSNCAGQVESILTKGESYIDWLRRLAQSEYLSFIENADEILNVEDELSFTAATS